MKHDDKGHTWTCNIPSHAQNYPGAYHVKYNRR
jgi:hypothetical protein